MVQATTEQACRCRKCLDARRETAFGMLATQSTMIVCRECGNKRCPHATDHDLACTRSNEPGQVGSFYA